MAYSSLYLDLHKIYPYMKNTAFIEQIRDLLAQDRLQEALRQLNELLEGSPKLKQAIIQSRRYESIENSIHAGVVSFENANMEKNKIALSILNLLDELEGNTPDPSPISEAAKEPTIIQNAEKIYNIKHIDKADFS